jgi:hypothetical protein
LLLRDEVGRKAGTEVEEKKKRGEGRGGGGGRETMGRTEGRKGK